MTIRRRTGRQADQAADVGPLPAEAPAPRSPEVGVQPRSPEVGVQPRTPLAARHAAPRSPEEAEARYVAARDAWTAAMRAANSGRSADLATLAVAQEAFEAAAAEVERWRRGPRAAVPQEPERKPRSVDAIVGQELAWRRVREHDQEPRPGLLGRIGRRLRGR